MNDSIFAAEVAKRLSTGIANKSAELIEQARRRTHQEIAALSGEITGLQTALFVMEDVARQMNEANRPKEQPQQ